MSLACIKKMEYDKVLSVEADFKLFIDNKLFFKDEYFPILEFIRYADSWLNSQAHEFEYNTIESEENPLLAFREYDGKFMIYSVWEKFHCDFGFALPEVKRFILSVIEGTSVGYKEME